MKLFIRFFGKKQGKMPEIILMGPLFPGACADQARTEQDADASGKITKAGSEEESLPRQGPGHRPIAGGAGNFRAARHKVTETLPHD